MTDDEVAVLIDKIISQFQAILKENFLKINLKNNKIINNKIEQSILGNEFRGRLSDLFDDL